MKIMNNNKRKILAFAALIILLISPACKKGDGEADFGDDIYVYMAQATVSGGINNHYPVPGGAGVYTYNFTIENGKLNIILGVSRSGKITDAEGFSADIVASPAITDEVVSSGEMEDAMTLPAALYNIQNNVAVEAGKNSASFYLTVDKDKLLDAAYDGKKLLLWVYIDSITSSKYKINEDYKGVVVVIDVDEIRSFF
jgi:hypothetical protein